MKPSEIFWLGYILPGLITALVIMLFGRYTGDPISDWDGEDKEQMLLIFLWPLGLVLSIVGGFIYALGRLIDLTTKEMTFKRKKQ